MSTSLPRTIPTSVLHTRCSVSFLKRLPPETLGSIIYQTVNSDYFSGRLLNAREYYKAQGALRRVCKQWNLIIETTNCFWTVVDLSGDAEFTNLVLRRCRVAPFRLVCWDDRGVPDRAVISQLSARVSRLASVEGIFSRLQLAALQEVLREEAPQLMAVRVSCLSRVTIDGDNLGFGGILRAQKLQCFHLGGITLPGPFWDKLPTASLLSFSLQDAAIPNQTLLRVLSRCYRMQQLSLHAVDTAPPGHAAAVQDHRQCDDDGIWLPCLIQATLKDLRTDAAAKLLACVRAPQCVTWAIDGVRPTLRRQAVTNELLLGFVQQVIGGLSSGPNDVAELQVGSRGFICANPTRRLWVRTENLLEIDDRDEILASFHTYFEDNYAICVRAV